MSSGFVSGGTTDAPIERDDAWKAAQQELEAARRLKAEQTRQSDGRSLFETLEANKGTTKPHTLHRRLLCPSLDSIEYKNILADHLALP
jgi:hypothetical protein